MSMHARLLPAISTRLLPDEIIFTSGTTDGINLVANILTDSLTSGDEIIISALEHHSNIVPWQMLAQRTGAKLKVIPVFE